MNNFTGKIYVSLVFFFVFLCIFPTFLSARFNVKTGLATGNAKVVRLDYAKGRNRAVLSAQAIILNKELEAILSPDVHNYFKDVLEKKILRQATNFFLSINIIKEVKERKNFSVTLEGKYRPDLLDTKLEDIGLPDHGYYPIKTILAEINPGNFNVKKHLKNLGFDVVKAIRQPSTLSKDTIKKLFSFHKNTTVLYEIQMSDTTGQHLSYIVKIYLRGDLNYFSTFHFTVSVGKKDAFQSVLSLTEQISEFLNRITLKARTVTELDSDKQVLEITGFKSTAEKLSFIQFMSSKKGFLFFKNSVPQASTRDKIVLNIKTPNFENWIRDLNASNNLFRLSVLNQNSNYARIRFQSNLIVRINRVREQKNSTSNYPYYYENEPNGSLYNINSAPANSQIYGKLRTQSDIDVYQIKLTSFNQLKVTIPGKSGKKLTVKLLDLHTNPVETFTVDGYKKDIRFDLKKFRLYNTLYVIFSDDSVFQSINIGRQQSMNYIFRIE